jgi:hypothetical protein
MNWSMLWKDIAVGGGSLERRDQLRWRSRIFGDLIILPIVNIYRKYYGGRMSLFLVLTFYLAMVLAALAVELLFGAAGWIPSDRQAEVGEAAFSLNYTTFLNVLMLGLAAWLIVIAVTVALASTNTAERHSRNGC